MLRDPLIILDFETTGLAPEQGDRLTEVGALRLEDGRVTERRQSLVNCGVRMPAHIATYTGITQAMVDAAPPVTKVLAGLLAFIGDTPVVAHGANFDASVLRFECDRAGLPMPRSPFLCSLHLARQVYPSLPSHSLGALAQALGIRRPADAHRAAADAELTARLMLHLGRELAFRTGQGVGIDDLQQLMNVAAPRIPEPVAAALCA